MERPPQQPPGQEPAGRHRNIKIALIAGACAVLLGTGIVLAIRNRSNQPEAPAPSHANITTTVFWVGEPADESNAGIHNRSSAWVENWEEEFGGVDDPDNRCDMLPCDFTPKENPFYFALPYNDLTESCEFKPSQQDVPWFNGAPEEGHSIIKNRWIKVQFNDKTAFAQWEDAGPFGEDDTNYVFGDAAPSNHRAGLDLSPATAEYLGIDGRGQTSWEFVEEGEVPDGPWRQTVTASLPDCAR